MKRKERNVNNNNNKIDKTSKNKKETLSFAARGILLAVQTNNAGFRVFNILFCQHCLFLLFNCGCRRQRLLLDFVVAAVAVAVDSIISPQNNQREFYVIGNYDKVLCYIAHSVSFIVCAHSFFSLSLTHSLSILLLFYLFSPPPT